MGVRPDQPMRPSSKEPLVLDGASPPQAPSPRQLRETTELMERLVAVTLFAGLLIGVIMVLRPFATALLFGAVLVMATWPLHERLRRGGLSNLAVASIMTVLAAGCILVPAVLLAPRLGERLVDLAQRAHAFVASMPTAPNWISGLPMIGGKLEQLWSEVARGQFQDILGPYAATLRGFLIYVGSTLAGAMLQIALSLAVAATFWLRGDVLSSELQDISKRLGGSFGQSALESTADSVRGVAYGVVGTAVMQAIALALGLAITGVPGAATLGLVALMIALSQIGVLLILIWGGAAWWLYAAGHPGWAIFMIVWGLLVSTVDNLVRPWLVSFGTPMPLTLVFIGVLGGFIAFGFLGMFIGPTLLAILLALLKAWRQPRGETAE